MNTSLKSLLLGVATLISAASTTSKADACGGFFCAQAQPVNQAAERIIFADNGDGTVTAVIQILYEGPSESFSWLLPISTAPAEGEIAVASDLAFQRLQAASNPQYTLNTIVEGTCAMDVDRGATGTGAAGPLPPVNQGTGGTSSDGGVGVEASGSVGPFNWIVISVAEGTAEPATAATEWLETQGYDVPSGASNLLGPYLAEGLFLLALQLTKGTDSGSIRPIVLTYDASKPMIPVKLTAVAANDDMGVMTWLLGESRAVPENYLSLELNEARINWFNAASNYNSVVIEAADDAGGQGFVTEFAGPTTSFSGIIWQAFEEQAWQSFRTSVFNSFSEIFNSSYYQWGSYDGYWDAVRATVTLPEGLAFADFQSCPTCYSAQVTLSPSEFMTALEDNVIEPMRSVQELIDAHPQVTRLYTTLSAAEMTLDPLFTFNPDLPEVSNVHTADRIVECHPGVTVSEASWRIELPQGGVVRGTADDSRAATWPDALSDLPPNIRVMRQSGSGEGRLVEDLEGDINTALDEYNASVPSTRRSGADDAGGCTVSSSENRSELAWVFGIAGLAAYFARRRRR